MVAEIHYLKNQHSPGWKRERSVLWISSLLNVYTYLAGKGRGRLVDLFTHTCLHRPGWKREGGVHGFLYP